MLQLAADVLAEIRGAKSVAKVGMKTEVTALNISAPAETVALLPHVMEDIKFAGRVTGAVSLQEGAAFEVEVILAEQAEN